MVSLIHRFQLVFHRVLYHHAQVISYLIIFLNKDSPNLHNVFLFLSAASTSTAIPSTSTTTTPSITTTTQSTTTTTTSRTTVTTPASTGTTIFTCTTDGFFPMGSCLTTYYACVGGVSYVQVSFDNKSRA